MEITQVLSGESRQIHAVSQQAFKPKKSAKVPIETMAFFRIWQILGDKKANPPIEPLLPISRTSFYAGIKDGRYPAPVKISERVSAWRCEDIWALLESLSQRGAKYNAIK